MGWKLSVILFSCFFLKACDECTNEFCPCERQIKKVENSFLENYGTLRLRKEFKPDTFMIEFGKPIIGSYFLELEEWGCISNVEVKTATYRSEDDRFSIEYRHYAAREINNDWNRSSTPAVLGIVLIRPDAKQQTLMEVPINVFDTLQGSNWIPPKFLDNGVKKLRFNLKTGLNHVRFSNGYTLERYY